MEHSPEFQWVRIPKQEDATQYITGMDALNIPNGQPGGDWHHSGWECLGSRPRELRLGCTETTRILGTRGVRDARRGLRQLTLRSPWGHPAGWRWRAVHAATYARAIIDMVAEAIAKGERQLQPDPRESIAWCGTTKELALCWSLWKKMEEQCGDSRRKTWQEWWEGVAWHFDHPRKLPRKKVLGR